MNLTNVDSLDAFIEWMTVQRSKNLHPVVNGTL
jgi:hypothetical protein